ncbi:MAG: zinc ribbon domain-containing protein, partial [Anaerolineae bacterium]|nr:zinc ribbon domain-containing protein [Anaerolineae bacterium]
MVRCTKCGAQNPDGALFCDECGASLQSPKPQPGYQPPPQPAQPLPPTIVPSSKTCPVCGATVQSVGAFCENCGASVTAPDSQKPSIEANLPPTQAIPGLQEANAVPAPKPRAAPTSHRELTCANCGAILEPDSAFCDMC